MIKNKIINMNSYLFKNEEGFFGHLDSHAILSVDAAQILQKWIEGDPKSKLHKKHPLLENEKEELNQFLQTITQFGIESCAMYPVKKNDNLPGSKGPNYILDAYAWVYKSGNFVKVWKSCKLNHTINEIHQEWEVLKKWQVSEKVKNLLDLAEVSLNEPNPLNVQIQIKNFKKWSIEKIDPIDKICSAKSFAIYVEKLGFLSCDGDWIPSIASARQFESMKAASQMMRSKKIQTGVIVDLHVELKSMVEFPEASPLMSLNQLKEALAITEKRNLQEILNKAEIESQLEELRQIKKSHPEWFNQTSSKTQKKNRL